MIGFMNELIDFKSMLLEMLSFIPFLINETSPIEEEKISS